MTSDATGPEPGVITKRSTLVMFGSPAGGTPVMAAAPARSPTP